MYQYTNKHNRSVAKNSSVKHTPSPKTIPNSAMLAGISTGDTSDFDLDGAMMQKMNALMNQIPAAEQEADRLSRGVHSTSFEGIREEMGQRLGADLSEIRLHTDAAAAEQADQIGAAAYTTGKDIYWGSGGFKPETMAHELVHTVQQGAVAGETSAVVPMGTVQMEPKLSLGDPKSSYDLDKDYMKLRKKMDKYNREENPIKKKVLEMELMKRAADYVSMYGTMDTPIHKGCTEDAESLIYQLSAPLEIRLQATNNLTAMCNSINDLRKIEGQTEEDHTSTKNKMCSTVANTLNGIWQGKIMNRLLSPTLLAILTETMAGQSANTTLDTNAGGGQYTGAANAVGVANARAPAIELDAHKDTSLDDLVPGFFHEATHGHADQVYGSIVTMPRECIPIEELVLSEETGREATATELSTLINAVLDSVKNPSPQLVASLKKIIYATKADCKDDEYYDRAMMGFEESNQDPTALKNLKAVRDNLAQKKYEKESDKFDYKSKFPTMIEYDPSINEALMRFELSPDGNRDSPFYLALKAAALRSHVKRHNANVMNQIMDME